MSFTPYALLLLLSACIVWPLAGYSWRFRHRAKAAAPLATTLFAAGAWSLLYALDICTSDLALKVFWHDLRFPFIATIPVSWVKLAVEHGGRGHWLPARRVALLLVIPAITAAVALTTPLHTLFRYDFAVSQDGPFPVLLYRNGVWFQVHNVYSNGLILVSWALLAGTLLQRPWRPLYLRRTALVLSGSMLGSGTDMLYFVGATPIRGFNPTPVVVCISGVLMAWALLRDRLLELVPIARSTVMEHVEDLVLVADALGRVVDFNRAAQRAIGFGTTGVLGRPLVDVLVPSLGEPQADAIRRLEATRLEVHVPCRDGEPAGGCPGDQWYVLTISRIEDGERRLQGWLVIFHDVTERTRAAREREQIHALIVQERATLAAVMDSMTDGLVVVDASGVVRHCNARAGALLGTSAAQAIGRSPQEIFPDLRATDLAPAGTPNGAAGASGAVSPTWPGWERALTALEQRPRYELDSPGPPTRRLQLQLFPLMDATRATGQGFGLVARDVTEVLRLARFEERERIAMDLHDGVIQSLYAIGLSLNSGEVQVAEGPAQTTVRQAREQINGVIRELRQYILRMQSGQEDRPSVPQGLQSLATTLRRPGRLVVHLAMDPHAAGRAALLDATIASQILQCAGEACSNVLRHAEAAALEITLDSSDTPAMPATSATAAAPGAPGAAGTWLRLTIRDDGRGFDAPPDLLTTDVWTADGHGLRNIALRAARLGGHLAVHSRPGTGTVIQLRVPLAPFGAPAAPVAAGAHRNGEHHG